MTVFKNGILSDNVVEKTSAYTVVSNTDAGKTFVVDRAVTFTLPAIAIGNIFTFVFTGNDGQGNISVNREAIMLEVFKAFEIVVKIKVQQLLDEFAATRGYDDLKSLVGYTTSSNPVYQAESARRIYLRDLTWPVLYQYFNDVMSGVQPIPLSWGEIASKLPNLS